MAITLRATKGTALTHAELDANFTTLQAADTAATAALAAHEADTSTHGVGVVVGTTETQTLTNKTLTAPVISTISNTGTITLPTSTTTLVGRDTTDTLTNKTLTSPTINGNVGGSFGIGVSPSSWGGIASPAIDIGGSYAITGFTTLGGGVLTNAYFDGANYKYKATGIAWQQLAGSSGYDISVASSGTAGNTITFSNVLAIDTSGNTTFRLGPFGYGNGAGGTVTQATNKGTGVTLNKPSGQITLNNAALAANTVVTFTLTNSFITTSSSIEYTIVSGATAGAYIIYTSSLASGSAVISVWNRTAGSLSEAVVFNFSVKSISTT